MTDQDMSLIQGTRPSTSVTDADKSANTARQVVICGDALEVMSAMPAGSVDVVVTSPPYNVGVPYRSHDDRMPQADYLAWMAEMAAQTARLLRDDGSAFINLGAGADPWQALDVALQFRRYLELQNTITWVKSIHVDGVTRGHIRPVKSERLLNRAHEVIFHFTKDGHVPIDRLAVGVPYTDKSNLRRWKGAGQDLRCGGNSWFMPYETIRRSSGTYRHPAAFPLELPRRCLRLHGKEGGTVLDPFLGSGTTLVAAQELGWNGIGVEMDLVYAEMARKRIAAVP